MFFATVRWAAFNSACHSDRGAPYPIEQPRRAAGQVEAALDGKGHLEDGSAGGAGMWGRMSAVQNNGTQKNQ